MNAQSIAGRTKRSALAALVLLLAAQALPVKRDNAPTSSAQTIYAAEPMPQRVRTILQPSCTNCHSDETRWPWYSYVAPVSWMVARDVHDARKNMNFSRWASYTPAKQEDKLEEICEQIMNGDMPDRKYALFHREARPTQAEREAVCRWTEDQRRY